MDKWKLQGTLVIDTPDRSSFLLRTGFLVARLHPFDMGAVTVSWSKDGAIQEGRPVREWLRDV